MTAALAVGLVLGFVLVRGSSDSPNRATLPTTAPTTSTPQPSTTIRPPATTSPPTTTPTPTTTAASVTYCTPADLQFSTITNATSYAPGQTVSISLVMRDVVPCVLQPISSGQRYNCPATIVIAYQSNDDQVYPWSGQPEECSVSDRSMTLGVGDTRTVGLSWNQQVQQGNGGAQAPPVEYFAEGTWAWSSASGSPNMSSTAAYFTIT